jgi:hypothetical protein
MQMLDPFTRPLVPFRLSSFSYSSLNAHRGICLPLLFLLPNPKRLSSTVSLSLSLSTSFNCRRHSVYLLCLLRCLFPPSMKSTSDPTILSVRLHSAPARAFSLSLSLSLFAYVDLFNFFAELPLCLRVANADTISTRQQPEQRQQ